MRATEGERGRENESERRREREENERRREGGREMLKSRRQPEQPPIRRE